MKILHYWTLTVKLYDLHGFYQQQSKIRRLHDCLVAGLNRSDSDTFVREPPYAPLVNNGHICCKYIYTQPPVWLPMKREKANIIPTKAVNTVARPYLFRSVYDRHSALCKSRGEGESSPWGLSESTFLFAKNNTNRISLLCIKATTRTNSIYV